MLPNLCKDQLLKIDWYTDQRFCYFGHRISGYSYMEIDVGWDCGVGPGGRSHNDKNRTRQWHMSPKVPLCWKKACMRDSDVLYAAKIEDRMQKPQLWCYCANLLL